jgi:hypothetical protein
MKTSALSEHPSFLDKEFRDDLAVFASAGDDVVNAIGDWIASLNDFDDTAEDKKWIPLARQTGKTIDELQTCFRPVRWISLVSQQDGIAVAELLDDLAEAGVISDESLRGRFLRLLGPLETLIERTSDVTAPSLPLLEIKEIQTRCVLVSEYDREFSTGEDTVETYKPSVHALHPRVVLELKFWGKESQKVGISLSERNLETMSKWLTFAGVQLKTLKEAIPEKMLPRRNTRERP